MIQRLSKQPSREELIWTIEQLIGHVNVISSILTLSQFEMQYKAHLGQMVSYDAFLEEMAKKEEAEKEEEENE